MSIVETAIRWALRSQAWAWLAPLIVFEIARSDQTRILKGFETVLGLAIVILIARRPFRSLSFLLVFFPFQTLVLAGLLRYGMPSPVVRGLRFWREAIIVGLAFAALSHLRKQRVVEGRLRFDALDKLVGGYVVLGTAYFLLPGLFVGTGPGAHLSFYARELGWRGDVMYFAIFLVCRHLGFTRAQVEALFRRVLATGVVVAIVGIFEFFDTHSWTRFVVQTIRVDNYNRRIIGSSSPPFQEAYGSLGGHHLVRIGSVMLDYLGAGFFFALCLGIGVEMLARGKAPWWVIGGLPLVGLALLFNQGRSAILGGAAAVLFGLRAQVGRSIVHRVRLAMALGLLLIVALPIAVQGGLGHRFVQSQHSNTGHVSALRSGLKAMSHQPLGRGLATGAGAGQLASQKGQTGGGTFLVSEDQWLQIGTQLGYLGVALYILSIALIVVRLRPTPGDPTSSKTGFSPAAARNAMVGLIVIAFVLQPFVVDIIDWTIFGLCGLALSRADAVATLDRRYVGRHELPASLALG